jgi:acyl-CoA synthetase (AMP-forming)/AMP-acid ligase II
VRRAADKTGIAKERIWIFDVQGQAVPQGYKSWQSLLTHGERDWPRFNDLETCRTTPAARLFSSGTTGLPKAATLTHYNFIAQHTLVHEYADKPYTASRIFCIPMFHASSVPTAHTSALRAGTPTYVLRRFELEPLLASIEKFGITELAVVPPIVVAMLMSPATKKYSLKSIKAASCGAAPLAKETQQRFRELLSPDATVTQVWGMTETSCVASMIHYPGDDTTGSVGKLLPCVDAKLVDDEGKDISDYDVRGELCVRGPTIIPGYFENPKANAESYDGDGYFHTGDIAYLSAETGFWYIVDRKKELIKVRGFQVAPPELEAVLLSHPNIIDAAVIGVKDATDKDVEHPRAYVVARPGAPKPTEQEVKDFLNGKLAKYKALTGGVVFLEAIPKNPSGKILKRMLREMVEAEEKAKRAKL